MKQTTQSNKKKAMQAIRFNQSFKTYIVLSIIALTFIFFAVKGILENIKNSKFEGGFFSFVFWAFILFLTGFFIYKAIYSKRKYSELATNELMPIINQVRKGMIEDSKHKAFEDKKLKDVQTPIDSMTIGLFPAVKIKKWRTGLYSVNSEKNLSYQKYIWDGKKTHTTAKSTTKGRKGKTLVGAAAGSLINPAGAVVGAVVGANGKKKTNTQYKDHEHTSQITLFFTTESNELITYTAGIKSDDIVKIEKFFFSN